MKAPTWTPVTCRLGDLKPWALSKEPCLNSYFSALCFFVAISAKSNQIAKVIGLLVIPIEFMRRNNVMYFYVARAAVLVSAYLASLIVSGHRLSSLTRPVFAVVNSPSVSVNVGRIFLSGYRFCSALNRAAYCFGVFCSGRRYFEVLSALRALHIYFFAKTLPAVLGAFSATKNCIFADCRFKFSAAFLTIFLYPPSKRNPLAFVGTFNAAKNLACHEPIRFYAYRLAALITSCINHFVHKGASPVQSALSRHTAGQGLHVEIKNALVRFCA